MRSCACLRCLLFHRGEADVVPVRASPPLSLEPPGAEMDSLPMLCLTTYVPYVMLPFSPPLLVETDVPDVPRPCSHPDWYPHQQHYHCQYCSSPCRYRSLYASVITHLDHRPKGLVRVEMSAFVDRYLVVEALAVVVSDWCCPVAGCSP